MSGSGSGKQTFTTSLGQVGVSQGGQRISPQSSSGQNIQNIYNRQAAQKVINKEQRKLFDRVTGAKDYKEAFNIQQASEKINPNIGTFQQAVRGGKVTETKGVLGLGDRTVTITDKLGSPSSYFKQTDFFNDKGQRAGTINEVSAGAEFFATPTRPSQKTAAYGPPAKANTFDFFNLGSGSSEKKKQSDNNYLTNDEKAFSFFPDVPQGDDFFSQAGRGTVKGASNTLAGFWNMGTMVESGIRQGTGRKALPESDYVKFYSTPVTNVETGFFDAVTGTVKGAVKGEKYDSKKRIETGFGEAADNFFGKPVESAGSLIELAPYFGYGAAKTGSRVVGDFFGSFGKTTTKGSKATGPQKTGNFAQDFFYTKPDKSTIFDLDTASVFASKKVNAGTGVTRFFGGPAKTGPSDFFKATSKTKGGGTYTKKSWTDNFMGGGKEIKSGSSFLIQKTKQKTKQKSQNKLVDQFFKPLQKQKTKTKQKQKTKQKPDFFAAFMPKQGQKQKEMFAFGGPKLSGKQKAVTKQPVKEKLKQDFLTPVVPKMPPKTKGVGAGGFWLFWGGGARGSKSKRNKRGDKSYTAWNVNDSKVGDFFGGPSYRTSKSTRVFKDADKQNKRAAKKQRKKNNDFITGFFD